MIKFAWQFLNKLSLLQKFASISLIAIALMGTILGQMLLHSVERQALDAAVAEAEVMSRISLQKALEPVDVENGLSADSVLALQNTLSADLDGIDVVDVKLWNQDQKVVFASETQSIGTTAADSEMLAGAYAGESVAHVRNVSDDEGLSPEIRAFEKVVEVFQPIQFGSSPSEEAASEEAASEEAAISGVLRTSIPYAAVAKIISEETQRLYVTLIYMFLLLYAVLFKLVAKASADLESRSAENERLARYDGLTGLPNRMNFQEDIDQYLAKKRSDKIVVGLIDLDRFKSVNDTLGHHIGDRLLVEVGKRLANIVGSENLVARLGGDEFAFALLGESTKGSLTDEGLDVASRVVTEMAKTFEIEGQRIDIGASVGVAVAPDHGTDLEELQLRSDVAMYHAKKSGIGYALYSSSLDNSVREQLLLLTELRQSMDEQLVVYYQPKICLASNETIGVEALVRWDHPERGLLYPDTFIPLAEDNGLMDTLTKVVLDQSLKQLSCWHEEGFDLTLSVNVCAAGLHNDGFTEMVRGLLSHHEVPPERLLLEITETTIASNPEHAQEVLAGLGESGIRFSIDDFGTGYSSLAVLRSLPVNELKIDRMFINDIDHPDGSAIVEYSIQLGHMLGFSVVAEGVETESNQAKLQELGCDVGQGYWFAKPIPADELTRWMGDDDAAKAA